MAAARPARPALRLRPGRAFRRVRRGTAAVRKQRRRQARSGPREQAGDVQPETSAQLSRAAASLKHVFWPGIENRCVPGLLGSDRTSQEKIGRKTYLVS